MNITIIKSNVMCLFQSNYIVMLIPILYEAALNRPHSRRVGLPKQSPRLGGLNLAHFAHEMVLDRYSVFLVM